ncbi:MAG: DUF4142 domain-containing protein [Candidatus Acidiferrum sp.]
MLLRSAAAKISYVAGITVVLTTLACWGVLAHQGSETVSADAKAAMTDKPFVRDSTYGDMLETKLGELAQQQGASEVVRNFGARMVSDYKNVGDRLNEVAFRESIALPTELATRDQATYERLSKLSGTNFDRAYAKEMMYRQVLDLQVFQHEARVGEEGPVRRFANQTIPMIRQHVATARVMVSSVLSSDATPKSGSPSR